MSRHPRVENMNQGPSYNGGLMWQHHHHSPPHESNHGSIPHESNHGSHPHEQPHPQQRYGLGPNQPYLRPYEQPCPQPDEQCSHQVTPTAENRWIHHLTYETPESHAVEVDRFYGHQARPEVDNHFRIHDMTGGNVSRFRFHDMAHGNT